MASNKKIDQYIAAIPDKRTGAQLRRIIDARFPTDANTGVTASTTQTQAGAQPLKPDCAYHEVTTVATAANAVSLPPAKVGEIHFVKNSGANAMQVYGQGTDTIDSVATATGVSHQVGEGVIYVCLVNGNYIRLGGIDATSIFTALTTGAINAGDSSLDVIGLAAAQGGSITLTGGVSSTSGNAGGAVALVGGAPGATGVGGAASLTGAAGGATSGAGGAVNMTGGAGTNGNGTGGAAGQVGGAGNGSGLGGAATMTGGLGGATNAVGGAATVTGGAGNGTGNGAIASIIGGASGGGATGNGGVSKLVGGAAASVAGDGGAAQVTGGAGTTTGNGGAVTITSGAAGSTGVAGAINIAVGAATSGNGSAITITGGNGANNTASGGNINLVPGTAVSTGIPGEVTINSVAGTFAVAYTSPLMTTAVPATGTAQPFFIADRAYRVKKASACVVTHGTSETFAITKDASGGAPGSGTNVLASVITTAASNTPVTVSASATITTCTLAAGDRLSFLTGGNIGVAAGLTISVLLVPV